MITIINNAFMNLSKRAEMNSRSKLVATFVDVGPLFTLLSNKDHQVLYGRRGTGKTHALSFLADSVHQKGDAAVDIDMRNIGSTGGLYADSSIPVAQRATRLLVDTLSAMHDGLYKYFVNSEELDLSRTAPLLDRLAEAITKVNVVGTVEQTSKVTDGTNLSHTGKIDFTLDKSGVKGTLSDTEEIKKSQQTEHGLKEVGIAAHRVHFGVVGQTLRDMAEIMQLKRVWLLIDEWSSVPLELQPYLADLLRRSICPIPNFTIKIASIEQRSRFQILAEAGDYIGFELGADISADLNLDDFMVFDNNEVRATHFFQELLFKHLKEDDKVTTNLGPHSSEEMIQQAFTQQNIFGEFVRATEGVPRDAINIITLAAQRALERKISMADIRSASMNWFQRDKESPVKSNPQAHKLLHWIIDEVIGMRRARAFLLKTDADSPLIDYLFDARVLHILKKNISTRDQPGVRYDVFKLDYGCYVDLINTAKAPQGLLSLSEDKAPEGLLLFGDTEEALTYIDTIDVPPDDYRAIRGAILELDKFNEINSRIEL